MSAPRRQHTAAATDVDLGGPIELVALSLTEKAARCRLLGSDRAITLRASRLDNRPFLRCIHGYALCCWRLGRFEEAERVFGRMLWLNPSDNQGVRFLIGEVRARRTWEEHREKG
jgi:tetratricopeptide (TPR) repeat protein